MAWSTGTSRRAQGRRIPGQAVVGCAAGHQHGGDQGVGPLLAQAVEGLDAARRGPGAGCSTTPRWPGRPRSRGRRTGRRRSRCSRRSGGPGRRARRRAGPGRCVADAAGRRRSPAPRRAVRSRSPSCRRCPRRSAAGAPGCARPPCTRYSKAWATVALGTVDAAVELGVGRGLAAEGQQRDAARPGSVGAARSKGSAQAAGPAEQADQDHLGRRPGRAARRRWRWAARTGREAVGQAFDERAQGQDLAGGVGEVEDHAGAASGCGRWR